MSTPYPTEESSRFAYEPSFDPSAHPSSPEWSAGLGYDDTGVSGAERALEAGALNGVAKGQAVLGGILHMDRDTSLSTDEQGNLVGTDAGPSVISAFGGRLEADALARAKAFTPDATTTGGAVQLLHSLASGATQMAIGGALAGPLGAGAAVGLGEAHQRYSDLIAQGVDPETAQKAAGWTGITAAAGAFVPGGVGGNLVTKVATGAVGNTVFGMASRYADHKILEDAGYSAMADQQKTIDSTQILTDLVLGATFGGLAHLHEPPAIKALKDDPQARDAAMTTNLSIRDRDSAPGIPTDPAAANAHSQAIETSIANLIQGKPVDITETGVTDESYLERPTPKADPIAAREVLDESKAFGDANARDIQAILEGRAPESQPRAEPTEESPGETYRLYHGARAGGERLGFRDKQGWYFTEDPEIARNYAGEDGDVGTYDVSMRKPYHAGVDEGIAYISAERRAQLEALGHDGAISHPDRPSITGREYAIFDRSKAQRVEFDEAGKEIPKAETPSRVPTKAPEAAPRETPRAEGAGADAREPGALTADHVEQILADNPDMMIPDDDGKPVNAAEALKAANDDAALTEKESKIAAQAAITCYMRRGN